MSHNDFRNPDSKGGWIHFGTLVTNYTYLYILSLSCLGFSIFSVSRLLSLLISLHLHCFCQEQSKFMNMSISSILMVPLIPVAN